MLPEYLQNLVNEYALLEAEFQGGDAKAAFEGVLARTLKTYEDFYAPYQEEERFAETVRMAINYLRGLPA